LVHKFLGPLEVFRDITKDGVANTEGLEWKNRRKVLTKVFNFEFIVSQIPTMVAIADEVFDEFEQRYWKDNPEKGEKKELNVKLLEVMVKYTSSIIISGFLGIDSLKEKLRGKSIVDRTLELSDLASESIKDPLLLVFGYKFMDLQLRRYDRRYRSL
jgi:cytochrome P450